VTKQKRVIFGITGSIAAYRSADITRRLMEKGFRVTAVMTRHAEKFITPLTLSGLTGEKTYQNWFEDSSSFKMKHIEFAKEADVLLIAPATANIIAKLSCAMADDLLTAIALGTKAPILIAPAMNTQMYQNKIVQENCSKLKKFGLNFVDPIKGKLACGENDDGHIADTDIIVKEVMRLSK
jgi:phosphopantothenoylcysteine decarboxylase/phosphopantothenate--cysteine ligase